jgi:hypothetical protein
MQHDMHGFDGILSKNTIHTPVLETENSSQLGNTCMLESSYPPKEATMAGRNHHGQFIL